MAPQSWQERMLPLMRRMLVVLVAFFLLASLGQITYMQLKITDEPEIGREALEQFEDELAASTTQGEWNARQIAMLARLEIYHQDRKYHHSQTTWVGALWLKYMGFVTGMILAAVGATFVLGKLRGPDSEGATDVSVKIAMANAHIRSASPGLILAFLGAALMFATIWLPVGTEVKPDAQYYATVQKAPSDEYVFPSSGIEPGSITTQSQSSSLSSETGPGPGPLPLVPAQTESSQGGK